MVQRSCPEYDSSCPKETCLRFSKFAQNVKTSKVTIVIVYVDDFLYCGPDIQKTHRVKKYWADQYKMKDLGPYGQFMVIKLDQNIDKKTIPLSQKL